MIISALAFLIRIALAFAAVTALRKSIGPKAGFVALGVIIGTSIFMPWLDGLVPIGVSVLCLSVAQQSRGRALPRW